jgi:hypothetical protein
MPVSISRLLRRITGASPQAPKHSPSLRVNPAVGGRLAEADPERLAQVIAASLAPDSAQGRFVQTQSL